MQLFRHEKIIEEYFAIIGYNNNFFTQNNKTLISNKVGNFVIQVRLSSFKMSQHLRGFGRP